jgi:hypothetical protein
MDLLQSAALKNTLQKARVDGQALALTLDEAAVVVFADQVRRDESRGAVHLHIRDELEGWVKKATLRTCRQQRRTSMLATGRTSKSIISIASIAYLRHLVGEHVTIVVVRSHAEAALGPADNLRVCDRET